MKRFLTMIVAACAFLAASAQHPMVTLSSDGELKFFTNLNALETALDSAKNGDTIYLSEGQFILKNGSCKITKRVSIIGNGYGSHILGDITISISVGNDYKTDAPLFDG